MIYIIFIFLNSNCYIFLYISGMVLYLREVSTYLALVCVLREEFFQKRSLLDYNINCFKESLDRIFVESPVCLI
jgi:Ras-related GTP-binding protein C/D